MVVSFTTILMLNALLMLNSELGWQGTRIHQWHQPDCQTTTPPISFPFPHNRLPIRMWGKAWSTD